VVVLEKLAGIEGQNSDKKQFLWPESKGEEIEVQGSKEKGKQREQEPDRVEEEEVRRQEEKNGIEGVEEGSSSFSPVAYSIGTRVL